MRPTMRTRGFISRPRSPARSAPGYAAPRAPRPTARPPRRATPRSPSSRTSRSIAPAIASTSPAGTRSPFSPSCTTSGMPPTAVAITGVPTASASSSVCGRFSHADVSNAASTPRKSLMTSSRVPAPRKRTRAVDPELRERVARAMRAPDRRPAPGARRRAPGRAPRAHRRAPSARSACPPCPASARESRARRAPRRATGATGARAPGSGRPRRARGRGPSRARSPSGTRSGRRSCGHGAALACCVARSSRTRSPPRSQLEVRQRAVEPSRAALPLVGLVGDELDDERTPCERRAEGGTPHHRRRVDTVGRRGRRAPPAGRPRDAGAARYGRATPIAPGMAAARAPRRRSSRPRPRGPPRGAPSQAPARGWPGPPTSGGQMPETTTTLTSSPLRERP